MDNDTATLIDEAVTDLVLMRAPMSLGDAGPMISVLVSLVDQAHALLFDAIADARDQEYTWEQIGRRLGTTPGAARHRYRSGSTSRLNQPRQQR